MTLGGADHGFAVSTMSFMAAPQSPADAADSHFAPQLSILRHATMLKLARLKHALQGTMPLKRRRNRRSQKVFPFILRQHLTNGHRHQGGKLHPISGSKA